MDISHTSYIYAGQLQPLFEGDSPPVIKIGKSDTPKAREIQLSRTKIPFDMKFLRLWSIPGGTVLREESWLHEFFDSIRIDGTEYFNDDSGALIGQLDMLMKIKGFEQVIDLHEEQLKETTVDLGGFQAFWNDFDQVNMPNSVRPNSKVRGWGRTFAAGKGFSYEYQPRPARSFISLWIGGNKQHRIDALYDELNQKMIRGIFETVEFNKEQTRIKVYIEGDRNTNPKDLQLLMISSMELFVKTMSPIIDSLK